MSRSSFQSADLLAAGALACSVLWVFHGSLALFFAQEDFRGLAVAKGLLPRHAMLWRYLSVQSFMDLFYPLFRDDPRPYHWVSLLLHAANAIALFALLRRRLSPPASFIAASFFATHPALFTALYWLSARSDILATTFCVCTIALAMRRDRWRWLAVPTYALALLSKESVILLPGAAWLIRRWAHAEPPKERKTRDWLVLALCGMSVAFGAYLIGGRAGIGIGTRPDAPYAIDFTGTIARNFLTYVGWVVDVAMKPSPLRFLDVQNPDLYLLALAAVAVWTMGCFVPDLRRRGWLVAGISFLLLLMSVFPLRNHTYHYFLYAPLMAASWCAGAAADLAMARFRQRPVGAGRSERAPRIASRLPQETLGWAVALLCFLALGWNGERLVRRMETRPMRVYPALRGDPIVSRAIAARNVIDGLRAAELPRETALVFVLRERIALLARIALRSGETPPPDEETYPETNVRTALFDGYGVRALVPAVESVAFARDSLPLFPRVRYAVYAPTGEVEVFSPTQLDTLLRSTWITKW